MPGGRPTDYNQELGLRICELMMEGYSLREICENQAMPAKSTVFRWALLNSEFSDHYGKAREIQAEMFADELVQISDDASNDITGELGIPNSVAVQRAKLRVDTRKWVLSKILAKKYGDKVQHTDASGDGPIQFVVTRVGQKEK